MFDITKTLHITANTATGLQKVEVRWPTDEEWDARAKSKRIVMKNLGRGKSQTAPALSNAADLKLYSAIISNGSPELTMGEADTILNLMGFCQILNVEVDGNDAVVDLQVANGPTHHRLRIPSADQVLGLQRIGAASTIALPYDQYEARISILPAARIYDECNGSSGDYAGPVPALHKDAVVRGVIAMIDREFGPRQDDANF